MDYQDEAAGDIEFSVSYDDYMEMQAQEMEDESEQMTEEEILKEEDSLLFHNEKF